MIVCVSLGATSDRKFVPSKLVNDWEDEEGITHKQGATLVSVLGQPARELKGPRMCRVSEVCSLGDEFGRNMISAISPKVIIQQWAVCGLPNDNLSVENGIIIATARPDFGVK